MGREESPFSLSVFLVSISHTRSIIQISQITLSLMEPSSIFHIARASPYQKFEHSVLMRGMKLTRAQEKLNLD